MSKKLNMRCVFMLKRVTSLLLCLLMVFSAAFLVSCDKEDGDKGKEGVIGDLEGFIPEIKNWGNQTVNILGYIGEGRVYAQCQIDVEETNGEAVNDAFYKRNELIKQNFGIDINLVLPEQGEDSITILKNDITAGLHEIDAIVSGVHYIAPLGIEGQLVDLGGDNIKYLNLDKSWWDNNLHEDASLNDKDYFITGDALVNDDEATYAVFFNKDLAKKNGIENIYDVVNRGEWTIDTMYEMIEQVSNTQTKTWGPDSDSLWGMVSQAYDILSFMHGFDQKYVDNSGEVPELRIDQQANITAFQKIHEILNDKTRVAVADYFRSQYTGVTDIYGTMYGDEKAIFANGNALFMPNSISIVNEAVLRETEISFGILPTPKLNKNQDQYITSVNVYACDVFAVPISNVDKLDVTCYALEAMAFLGEKYVTDEYYTRTVSLKRLKDAQDSEMLDLIFDNKTYDMGCVFNLGADANNSGSLYFYSEVMESGEIVSHYEKKKDIFQAGIDDLVGQAYSD